MEETLCAVVRGRQVLSVRHKGLTRVVEPYLVFASRDGTVLLHG